MRKMSFLLVIIPSFLGAQSFVQGPNSPSTGQNTSCPFSYSSPTNYTPATNAFASDNAYATASHCDCCDMNTRCFETSAYGFTIPIAAVIDGIKVEVEKKASSNSTVNDNGVKLLKAGNTIGTDHALVANWGYADAYSVYGSATDLWGTTWTPADINDPNFGLAFASISYTCFGNGVPVITSIDHIRITIYYTDNTTSISSSASMDGGHMIIAPNPTSEGDVLIRLPLNANEVNYTISDITGKLLFEKIIIVNGNDLHAAIPSSIASGIYFIQISGLDLNDDVPFLFRDKLIIQ